MARSLKVRVNQVTRSGHQHIFFSREKVSSLTSQRVGSFRLILAQVKVMMMDLV
jgi:hypothetical protein